jgi:hypothetical protein
LIDKDPLVEHGYRDLLNPLLDTKQYDTATAIFHDLKQRHPRSIWPRKILAELYHEYTPSNPRAFRLAYDEMRALRQLSAYGQVDSTDHNRVEADFIEVVLSAERYDEMDSLSAQLLARTQEPVTRLNLALFAYFADVMQGNRDSAFAELSRLQAVIASLPPQFYNGWLYPGTRVFIHRSGLPERLRQALDGLCKEEYWYTPVEAAAIVTENRQALQLLPAGDRASVTRPR